MKQYPTIAIALLLLALFSSCKKQTSKEPFWTSFKKFEFQNTSYIYITGNVVEIIYLSRWSEIMPEKTTVKIFTGVIGGQQSFSNPATAKNFLYITDSASYAGNYLFNDISIATPTGSKSIGTIVSGFIQTGGNPGTDFDYRKIVSLTFEGKIFLPMNNSSYFIAQENEIGIGINKLVTMNKNCSFTGCLNGVNSEIKWYCTGADMSITANGVRIEGKIVGSTFSTPLVQADNGDLYIIQFYTLADNSQVGCTCTMNFKLYKVVDGPHKNNSEGKQFQLVIGDC